jgi:hypothetical protein
MQLDVQPVRRTPRQLADPVPLLELEDESIHYVVDGVELVEAEGKRGRLFPRGEEEPPLDIVRPAEVVTLVERELPALTVLRPGLDLLGEVGQRVFDLDRDRSVGAFLRSGSRKDCESRHVATVPRTDGGQT